MLFLAILVLFLNVFAICGRIWLANNIGLISMDEVIYHLKVPIAGTSTDMAWSIISGIVILPIVITTILVFLLTRFNGHISLRLWKKTFMPRIRTFLSTLVVLGGLGLITVQFFQFNADYGITDYIVAQSTNSEFIEEHYVDPNEVEITFPEEKRNLIYIYLESTEATYFSEKNGGRQKESLQPELESLALSNTSFSNRSNLGGAYVVSSSNWTMAGIIAHTAGIPLKLPFDSNTCTNDKCTSLLGGATAIGNILEKEGYNQMFMAGSDMTFGGRRAYLTSHGNYEIRDIFTAEEDGIIPKDRRVYWGMEDTYLFEYAKQELTELASRPEPFSFNLLTVNTHFPDGYLEDSCPRPYEDQYSNVIACSSTMVNEFVEWIQEQPFYANTTIILAGDHLTMAANDILGESGGSKAGTSVTDSYIRATYNAIINPAMGRPNRAIGNNRIFTTMDMFPTTLAAMGVEIEGNKLGLGTNLYSGERTLAEEYDFDYLNEQFNNRSEFYIDKFIQQ